jgi:hypothetical protein
MHTPNVTLSDQNTGVVNALCKVGLEDLGLETTFQEILHFQRQHVIQTHAGLIQHTNPNEPTNKGVTLEETLRIFVIKFKQLTGCTTDFGKDETDTPDLTLVS